MQDSPLKDRCSYAVMVSVNLSALEGKLYLKKRVGADAARTRRISNVGESGWLCEDVRRARKVMVLRLLICNSG